MIHNGNKQISKKANEDVCPDSLCNPFPDWPYFHYSLQALECLFHHILLKIFSRHFLGRKWFRRKEQGNAVIFLCLLQLMLPKFSGLRKISFPVIFHSPEGFIWEERGRIAGRVGIPPKLIMKKGISRASHRFHSQRVSSSLFVSGHHVLANSEGGKKNEEKKVKKE